MRLDLCLLLLSQACLASPRFERLRIVVGSGSGGFGLRHARVVSQIPVAMLCVIFNRSPAGSTASRRILRRTACSDVSALLVARTVDAAIVATQFNSRHDRAHVARRMCLNAPGTQPVAADEVCARASLEAECRAVCWARLTVRSVFSSAIHSAAVGRRRPPHLPSLDPSHARHFRSAHCLYRYTCSLLDRARPRSSRLTRGIGRRSRQRAELARRSVLASAHGLPR